MLSAVSKEMVLLTVSCYKQKRALQMAACTLELLIWLTNPLQSSRLEHESSQESHLDPFK